MSNDRIEFERLEERMFLLLYVREIGFDLGVQLHNASINLSLEDRKIYHKAISRLPYDRKKLAIQMLYRDQKSKFHIDIYNSL